MQFTWAQAEDDSPKDEDSGKNLQRKTTEAKVHPRPTLAFSIWGYNDKKSHETLCEPHVMCVFSKMLWLL